MTGSPYETSATVKDLARRVQNFMDEEVYPAESIYYEQEAKSGNRWTWQPVLRELRAKAGRFGK